jgi:hypothetical protein
LPGQVATPDGGSGAGGGGARQWRVQAEALDRALAELRAHVGDQPGEVEIIWRPAS